MGALAEALGLYGEPEQWKLEEAEDRISALKKGALQFLRGGGSVSVIEWGALSELERAMLAVAGDELRTARTLQLARALSGPEGEASVMAVLDEGDAYVSLALSRFMDANG